MKKMIKITEYSRSNGYREYLFSNDTFESNFKCPICRVVDLSVDFVEIIYELMKKRLLPEDYEPMCCVCYYINKKLGFNYCTACGAPLRARNNGYSSHNYIDIYCYVCGKKYE